MEEDIRLYESSPTKTTEKIEKKLEEAIKKASEKLNYESAHDEEIIHALAIVKEFIKRKKRVLYGGTAMNAILPDSKKFYDPRVDLPDYDFYTPDVDNDLKEIVEALNKAGFKEVHHKVGIHEGTKKIMVNYTAVADISSIDPDLFAVFLRRSIVKDGVHYTDENILRMMMYLELSRPKGMVERWTKVFERLQLINELFPIKGCSTSLKNIPNIPTDTREVILEYIIEWQRILCNGPIVSLYSRGIHHGDAIFRIQAGGPLLFISPDPKVDSLAIKKLLPHDVSLFRHVARGDIVPERIEIRKGDTTLCIIVKEIACHSYVNFPLADGRYIHVGSLEFLITLYLSLIVFTTHSEDILGSRALCYVKRLIGLCNENYTAKKSQFPAFALQCRGHQTKYTSLLRNKVARIKKEREKMKTRKITKPGKKTRRRK